MAHSYDQTLLQRMGFSDPDRRTPAHDNACVAIATEPERFVRTLRPKFGSLRDRWEQIQNGDGSRFTAWGVKCYLEVPIQKGEDKYKTTIGFADSILTWSEEIDGDPMGNLSRHTYCQGGPWDERSPHACHCLDLITGCRPPGALRQSMLVEVKTEIDSIGNLLRQMNLYREYAKHDEYVVFSLNRDDTRHTELLKQQGYTLLVRT